MAVRSVGTCAQKHLGTVHSPGLQAEPARGGAGGLSFTRYLPLRKKKTPKLAFYQNSWIFSPRWSLPRPGLPATCG